MRFLLSGKQASAILGSDQTHGDRTSTGKKLFVNLPKGLMKKNYRNNTMGKWTPLYENIFSNNSFFVVATVNMAQFPQWDVYTLNSETEIANLSQNFQFYLYLHHLNIACQLFYVYITTVVFLCIIQSSYLLFSRHVINISIRREKSKECNSLIFRKTAQL